MGLMGRRAGCLRATGLNGDMRDHEVLMGVLRGLLCRLVFVAGVGYVEDFKKRSADRRAEAGKRGGTGDGVGEAI